MTSKRKGPDEVRDDERVPLADGARRIGKGFSKHTLRSWIRQGRVPFYRVGRRIYLSTRDIDELVRQSRVEARRHAGPAA